MESALSQLFQADQLVLQSAFSPIQILLSLMITLTMVLGVYLVYKLTYDGVLYSKNFNLTLIMTALVVNAIMIGISGNIVLSLGLVGALSIIRFRTAVKDPKDTAYLFWAITIGVINGVAYYELSLIASAIIAVVLFVMSRSKFSESSHVLVLGYQGVGFEHFAPVLDKHLKKYSVRSDTRTAAGTEKIIEVRLKNQVADTFVSEIHQVKGVTKCILLASNGEFAQ